MIRITIATAIWLFLLGCSTSNGNGSNKSAQNPESTSDRHDTISFRSEQIDSEIVQSNNSKNTIELKQILTHSGQFQRYKDIIYAGCEFQLVTNNQNDTTYLATTDDRFITPEGYKVGTLWMELSENERKSVERMPGWGYYIELKSDWQLGFCEGPSCTDNLPDSESKVIWIFKRK